jgi:hypothetical protein
MKTRSVVLTLALCLIALGVSFAAEGPEMGTWKLNEAKSKIPAGFMKNTTVVYSMDGDKIKVTTDGTDAKGAPMHTEWTGNFDGKAYPLTGDPNSDSRSYKKVSSHVLSLANMKDGKPTTTGKITVSPDGKTRTLSVTGTDDKGKKVSSTAVYDKQ